MLLLLSLLSLALAGSCEELLAGMVSAGGLNAVPLTSAESRGQLPLCMDSLLSVTDADRAQTLAVLRQAADVYAFVDDLRSPPPAIQQPGVDTAVDIPALLGAVADTRPFAFFVQLQHIWALARDAHTEFALPSPLASVVPYLPLRVCADYGSEVTLRVCAQQYTRDLELLRELGFTVGDSLELATINGVAAYDFLRGFADTRALTGRDVSQRFEYALALKLRLPGWHALAQRTATGIDATALDLGALELGFADGHTTTVPYVAVFPQALVDRLRGVASNSDIPEPDLVARVVNPRSEMRAGPADATTHERYLRAAASDSDVALSVDAARGVCVLSVRTFAPANDEVWVQQLDAALEQVAEQRCGVATGMESGLPTGTRLVVDARLNGGGAMVLLNLLLDALFPDYSAHHTQLVAMRQPGEESVPLMDALLEAMGMQHAVVREPYSFGPSAACDGAYKVDCGAWWRKATRERVLSDRRRATWSRPALWGTYFWEAPHFASLEEYDRWASRGDVRARYGNPVLYWHTALLQRHGVHPAPELTTLVLGPVSASCTGQLASDALAYRLGAVALTAFPGHDPLMPALVPGGNVVRLSAAEGDDVPRLPLGSDLAFTDFAELPRTRETERIAGADVPLEFVVQRPHFVVPYHTSLIAEDAERGRLLDALATHVFGTCTPGLFAASAGADCSLADFPHAASVGRACTASGRYDGACGVARCEFGYELVDGHCTDVGFTGPGVLPVPLGAGAIAGIVVACVVVAAAAAVGVFFVVRTLQRKGRGSARISEM